MEWNQYKAWELIGFLAKKEVSSREITESVLKRIEERKQINAYISVLKESALQAAAQTDEQYRTGQIDKKHLIAGIPIAVKDNICYKNNRTTCGSRILEQFIPPYNAFVINRILEHRGIIIGKTNMDEFAMGSSTETSFFGPTLNPADTGCIPGGSSGGSAAAVADSQAILGLGSDTGGSIRQPASLCGCVGMKPTYGLVSRFGLVAFASSLDQIGGFTRDVKDMSLLLNVIAGHDKKDSTSVDRPVPDYFSGIGQLNIKGIKIGIPREYFIEGMDKEIKERIEKVIKLLEKEGAIIEETSLPHTEYAVADYYIIAPAEASSNLARYDGVKYGYRSKSEESANNLIQMYFNTRKDGFGPEVKRRILLGTYSLSSGYYDAYYLKALKVRTLIKQDFEKAFKKFDVLLTPTSPTPAFRIGEKIKDPLQMYLSDIFTISTNMAGIPGISLPAGNNSKGLPVGVQLMAGPFEEKKLLQISYALEQIIKDKV
ncbi:MAG: Asp-tRNA(Asn)/Glu-tRNA(Gln) amidotransferase subunit GatA [bacterium]|nr:Asp-tRNA(Asn)/Glu-tRNA(Gln) amidotransferase subunit GatA [bacterium]